jgi:amino acid transporter
VGVAREISENRFGAAERTSDHARRRGRITGEGSAANLTLRGITENAPNYFAVGGGLMLAKIMGLTTLGGFDAAANLAEEARDPYRSVPRAIVGSVAVAGLLGMALLIAAASRIRSPCCALQCQRRS